MVKTGVQRPSGTIGSLKIVVISWVSFIVKRDMVPDRMCLLVTIFLVLINSFNGVKSNAPVSTSLNAVDLYILICIGQVFLALIEYAVVLVVETYKVKPTSISRVTNSRDSSEIQNNDVGTTPDWLDQHPCRNKLDYLSLLLFPIFFIVFNIIYCIIYI